MNISRQEADEALQAIHSADHRVWQVQSYRHAAPFLILWGLIWVAGNAAMDFSTAAGNRTWQWGSLIGTVLTAALVVRLILERKRAGSPQEEERRTGASFALMGWTVIGFFIAMYFVLRPLSPRQGNAFISLFWAFAYMFAGAWVGLRLFFTGLVAAVAMVIGFLFIHEHYYLWMAAFGGGSLIVGGLWLRKI
jgi:hypothetical protein